MKPGVAWNVTGVGPEARETARERARRAGLSVGEWLDTVITGAADDGSNRTDQDHRESQGFAVIRAHLDALAARLGQDDAAAAERRGAETDSGSNLRELEKWLGGIAKDLARCGEETPHRVAEAISRLNERLDHLIAGGRSVAGEFERRVAAVDCALNELNGEMRREFPPRRRPPIAPDPSDVRTRQRSLEDAFSPRNVDHDAVDERLTRSAEAAGRSAYVSRHGADLPARGEDVPPRGAAMAASQIDRQIRTLSRQLEMMRRPCNFDESVAALRHDLGNIGDALAKAMPRCALDALESEVESLYSRVDRGRHRHGDQAAMTAIEQRLEKLQSTLTGLTPAENVGGLEAAVEALSEKIDVLAARGPDVTSLQHIETAIGELRGLTERVASGEALATLAREVRTLGERVDRFAGFDARTAATSLERRLEALSEIVNARTAEAGKAVSTRLEPLINGLLAQLDRLDLGTGAGGQAALNKIEGQIAKLANRIEASDARLGNVDMIERGLADLFLQIEETRANAVGASEFKRDLADLRMTQTEADRRTQQTLETIQSMVERLADRLAAMETEARAETSQRPGPYGSGPGRPGPGMREAAAPGPGSQDVGAQAPGVPGLGMQPTGLAPLSAWAAQPSAAEDLADETTAASRSPTTPPHSAGAPATSPRAPIDPSLPADHPLEPGFAGRGRTTSAAERIAASEGALGGIRLNSAPEANDKANFIAAARRAAQSAAAEPTNPGAKRSADIPLSEAAWPGETLARLKRPFFMSVAAAILVVGATHVTLTLLGSSNSARLDTPGDIAVAAAAAAREAAKPATAEAVVDSTPAAAGNPLFAPVPSSDVIAPAAPPGTLATAGPFDPTASSMTDVTGSVIRPADAPRRSDFGQPRAPVQTSQPALPAAPAAVQALAPAADGLPAAIGGPGLRSAAAAGDPAAAYEIAFRYAEGRGVPQSFSEAARWFERAAAGGLAPAQYRLGSLYEKGHGVKKDVEAARRLYTAAAEKGNARAMHNLAVLSAEGIEGKPDYKTAFDWFRRAASYGIADSQYNLGILYARGIGTEQNLAESYKWFALAAQQGDADASRRRDDVGARLDSQSLVAARLAAQTFAAEAQPEEATSVRAPAGGWDRPAAAVPAPATSKPRPAQRKVTGPTPG